MVTIVLEVDVETVVSVIKYRNYSNSCSKGLFKYYIIACGGQVLHMITIFKGGRVKRKYYSITIFEERDRGDFFI